MQAKVMAPVFVAFVVAVAAISAVAPQERLDCPAVDDKGDNATYLPNLYNCSQFYVCAQGVPMLMECKGGLHFNRKLNVCDRPWNALCVALSLPGSELPTTVVPVPTEKVVITKTVKEVYRPVDDEAPQL
ncbi:peritrophin-1 [Rhipicephalus sanguineus]|uniref:Chitin-binding type-2 domain-containing protein n=1 Tax=Rhipicephalus sanguineus TaxID=34632 RepID=A0A9D4PTY8_RHISA|nr:peritrophin-1 [Rhipicephalus sanguineus]XP_049271742.1 peritrophin-1 [Rhipicephalus sanguineus]KAH7951695.1 hypothetical protein HPB52_011263 [Rhipicephalus sanguineus]